MINFAALGFLRNFCVSFSPKQHTISVFYIDGTLWAALGFLRNFCVSFSPKQHTISVFYIDGTLSGLGLGLGLAMQLVSAFRCRRQKLYLNRARF